MQVTPAKTQIIRPDGIKEKKSTLVASCFLGAFPPVDLRAVCLVRAIYTQPIHQNQSSK